MSKKILIIGMGYIGSRLYLDLKDKYDVKTLDIGWFNSKIDPNTLIVDYNYLDGSFFRKFDVIILTAGHSSVAMCLQQGEAALLNNVMNFKRLLNKLRTDAKLIYMSSSSVYASTNIKEANELTNCFSPINDYDLNKHEADNHAGLSNIESYGLRLGTVAGFSPNIRIDTMINAMWSSAYLKGQVELFNAEVMRPILGLSDLSRVVSSIIHSEKNLKGLYNVASFNLTAGEIAERIADFTAVPIINKGEQKVVAENTKLESKAYNFSISTLKIRTHFDFEFKDTVESICEELTEKYKEMEFSKRTAQINYE